MKKKYRIVTLGCRTNQYESQAYADQLQKMGYEAAQKEEKADLCIVNSCTVTKEADHSSKAQIRKLANANPEAKVIVTGCLVDNGSENLLTIGPNVETVSNKNKENLIKEIFPDAENLPEFSIQRFEAHTRAFVKVQDGCNSFCTYCIIPYVRGRSRSRKISEVIDEVKGLVRNGYKEVVITGINVGDFEDGDHTLADLIKEVDRVEGIRRVRLSSIDPDEVDEALTDAILHGTNTCASMHIVLQAGSNAVLKKMNRKYTKQMFIDTVEKLCRINPTFTITTDVIVGFPHETEEDFEQTLDLIRRLPFAKVHVFPYSKRPRTRAALYPIQVPPEIAKDRKQKLLRLAEQRAFEVRQDYVGKKMSVLLEGKEKEGYIFGHTDNFLLVKVPSQGLRPNEIIEVVIEENRADALYGVPCA
jgi:threonylcarbamoyladenosine tRNA methylthiotransferase MtaB